MIFRIIFKSITVISIIAVFSCSSDRIINKPVYKTIDLQGHRGARGLKPENTRPAFLEALKYHMNTIELDTNLTKDNRLIVHHDSYTNPDICLSGNGERIESAPIRKLTVTQLKELDCGKLKNPDFKKQRPVPGTKLMTLDDFFSFVKQNETEYKYTPYFNIELKYPENVTESDIKIAAKVMVETIEKAGMVKRTTVQSFNIDVLPYTKKLNPEIKTSALYSTGYVKGFLMYILGFSMGRLSLIKDAQRAEADIISPHYSYVSEKFVSESHKNGLAVIPWTVNSKKEMIRLLDAGVDGIISDYPDILRKTYDEWKKKN